MEAAAVLSRQGAEVVMVDQRGVGGTCLHVGCIPAKLLLECARHAEDGATGWSEFRRRFSVIEARHERGATAQLRKHGVTVVHGEVSTDADGVYVTSADGTTAYLPRLLVLATGSRPTTPPFPVADVEVLTSDTVFSLDALPPSLVVIGGGAVGVELAEAFAELEVAVTLVELADRIVPRESEEASARLARALSHRGVKIHCGSAVQAWGRADGAQTVELGDGICLRTDAVLFAAGREVDAPAWVYPSATRVVEIGDRAGGAFAHEATAMGQAAAEAFLFQSNPRVGAIPRCTYTSPEVVGVGLTEQDARLAGHDVICGQASWQANPRADMLGRDGLTSLVADARDGTILGAHIVGDGATELAGLAVALLDFEATVEDVRWIALPHPTISETLREAAVHASLQRKVVGAS
jgi:dihydrolipoamide dehydrogenase